MLNPQVIVDLLQKLGIDVDLVSHRRRPGERFKCAAEHFVQSLHGIAVENVFARGVCRAEPTRSLFGAGVATTPPAVRFP